MNLLITKWYTTNLDDIASILERRKNRIYTIQQKPRNFHYDPLFKKFFLKILEENFIDAVFSIQYFPILSSLCQEIRIPYISWCYNDSINQLLLTKSIFHTCNIIFHSDSLWCEKLQKLGIQHVYYLPWAVSINNKSNTFHTDICLTSTNTKFVKKDNIDLFTSLNDGMKGFLDSLMDAQEKIYGFNFIENVLYSDILASLQMAFPLQHPRNSFQSEEELYAYSLLYPEVSLREYTHTISHLEKESIPYTTSDDIGKINILLSSRDIQNGIHPKAWNIFGHGGFLLTNFQNDYLHFFKPNIDYVFYESVEDMIDKIKFYSFHEEERQNICNHALSIVCEHHTFELRINKMLTILNSIKKELINEISIF